MESILHFAEHPLTPGKIDSMLFLIELDLSEPIVHDRLETIVAAFYSAIQDPHTSFQRISQMIFVFNMILAKYGDLFSDLALEHEQVCERLVRIILVNPPIKDFAQYSGLCVGQYWRIFPKCRTFIRQILGGKEPGVGILVLFRGVIDVNGASGVDM